MCPHCQNAQAHIIKKGFYRRRLPPKNRIQRYLCRTCGKFFSDQTGTLTCGERKPQINNILFRLLGSGMSQRRSAAIIGVHPTTVARKLVRFERAAGSCIEAQQAERAPVEKIVFDEMETFE